MFQVSAQENTWETWKSSTSPQLEKEKDAISSALSDVVQRHGFGTCSDFLQEHGGRYFLEHQHHEFVFDLQNGTNCYATSSPALIRASLHQLACTIWSANTVESASNLGGGFLKGLLIKGSTGL